MDKERFNFKLDGIDFDPSQEENVKLPGGQGSYSVPKPVKSGMFGDVYLCYQEPEHDEVAVKV